ncbi:MAG TPA: hypothetical protein VLA02_11250 [Reyranella sp.]|nr:hypothetical protein [Reyranella sp.]
MFAAPVFSGEAGTMVRASVALVLAGLAATPVRAETDGVQLASNMIWCCQTPHHTVEPYAASRSTYRTSDDGRTWKVGAAVDTEISRSRAEYVRDIQVAAARRDAAMAKEIYLMCQRYNPGALKYADAATDAQWVSVVVHAAACYSPDHGTNSPPIRRNGKMFGWPYGPIACAN